MTKKLIFAALFSVLAIASAAAQNKTDNFLGTWKLTKTEGMSKSSTIRSIVLNISQTGDDLQIERNTQGTFANQIYSRTKNDLYNIKDPATVGLIAGRMGGTVRHELRVLSARKLRFDTLLDKDYGTTANRELWIVSDDGKTLTIETSSRFSSRTAPENSGGGISSKMFFSKQ
jgi:hypothetical protein